MKANTVSGITHLLPAGKSHSFSIMHEIDNSVNNYGCVFAVRIVLLTFTISFIFILLTEQKNEARKLPRLAKICGFVACAKIRTRPAATNKNFHGTRFAQTPGNFYCSLSMPLFNAALRSNSYFGCFFILIALFPYFWQFAIVRYALTNQKEVTKYDARQHAASDFSNIY